MKKVIDGLVGIDCTGSGWNAGLNNCYICCLRYEKPQPAPLDPNYMPEGHCMDWCNL
jgi:hypothetical protein